jgi:hypothetical protein
MGDEKIDGNVGRKRREKGEGKQKRKERQTCRSA